MDMDRFENLRHLTSPVAGGESTTQLLDLCELVECILRRQFVPVRAAAFAGGNSVNFCMFV